MQILKNYLLNCSIPALPYLPDVRYHWSERVFWIISITLSWVLAVYIMTSSYYQFKNNPISFTADTSYLNWKTQFPAVVFCEKGNTHYRQYADTVFGKNRSENWYDVLKDIVFFKGALEGNSHKCKPSPAELGYQDCPVATANFTVLTNSIRSKCKEIFGFCSWNNVPFNCCTQIKQVNTVYGVCYSINSLSAKRSKNPISMVVASTGTQSVGTFTVELLNPDVKVFLLSTEQVPSYTHSKSLVFDGTSLSPHLDEKNVIHLYIEETVNDLDVMSLSPDIRRCRFPEENFLKTATIYSYPACTMECLEKLHLEVCNCTHHLMPGAQDKHICNMSGLVCLTTNFDHLLIRSAQCNCVSSCIESEIVVSGIIVYSNYKEYVCEGFKNNSSTTEISFKLRPPTVRYIRKMVNGYLDLIVYMGGTAGLCMGASLLSIAEFLYYFLMRPLSDSINKPLPFQH